MRRPPRPGQNRLEAILTRSYVSSYDRRIDVEFHPTFAGQFEQLSNDDDLLEVAGEVMALIGALEQRGRQIEGTDVSHRIVIARTDLHTLRRTPPNEVCPYADIPPVIRIFYVWFTDITDRQRGEFPVVFSMGDKSQSPNPNAWYPGQVNEIETRLIPQWVRSNPTHAPRIWRTR